MVVSSFATKELRMFDFLKPKAKRRSHATDRRAGGSIPHAGKQPRARNADGRWRRKRSNAGTKLGPRAKKGLFG